MATQLSPNGSSIIIERMPHSALIQAVFDCDGNSYVPDLEYDSKIIVAGMSVKLGQREGIGHLSCYEGALRHMLRYDDEKKVFWMKY